MVAGADPEAEAVFARLLQRLDHAHEVGRRAAEAGAAQGLHLVQQAGAEEEPELAGGAAPLASTVTKWQMPLVK